MILTGLLVMHVIMDLWWKVGRKTSKPSHLFAVLIEENYINLWLSYHLETWHNWKIPNEIYPCFINVHHFNKQETHFIRKTWIQCFHTILSVTSVACWIRPAEAEAEAEAEGGSGLAAGGVSSVFRISLSGQHFLTNYLCESQSRSPAAAAYPSM